MTLTREKGIGERGTWKIPPKMPQGRHSSCGGEEDSEPGARALPHPGSCWIPAKSRPELDEGEERAQVSKEEVAAQEPEGLRGWTCG